VQAELIEACRELDLPPNGTKDVLAYAIVDHFGAEAAEQSEDELAPGETVTLNQAAVMLPKSVRLAQTPASAARGVEDLAARIKALDETINVRTQQLEDLRSADKCAFQTRSKVQLPASHISTGPTETWQLASNWFGHNTSHLLQD
jgi:hypothetical protein